MPSLSVHHCNPHHRFCYTAGEDVQGGDPGLLHRAPQTQAEGAYGGRMSRALASRSVRLPNKPLHSACPYLEARVPVQYRQGDVQAPARTLNEP